MHALFRFSTGRDFSSASHWTHCVFTRATQACGTSVLTGQAQAVQVAGDDCNPPSTHGDKAMAAHMQGDGARRGNRWRPAIWGGAALLLLLPLLAMQFFPASGVNWTLSDFVVMGAMLSIACGAYELVAWLSGNTAYRAAAGVAILAGFLTVWVNLAVGMIGDEGNPYNLLFAGVLAIGLFGALFARLEARGMVRAMYATALAQALVAAVALVAGWDPRGALFSTFFAAPGLVSAALFAKAARDLARTGATR
jgi:hypothetical protein